MADSSSSPDFSELIHDLQIEIEEYGEDFVFLGFWKKARMNKEVLTGFMFQEDLDKADLPTFWRSCKSKIRNLY